VPVTLEDLHAAGYKLVERVGPTEVVLEDEFGTRELWEEIFGPWYGYAVLVDFRPYHFIGKLLGKRVGLMGVEKSTVEGWNWLVNTPKWHYFRGGISLCGSWMGLGLKEYEQGGDDSPDNCKACQKKLAKEKLKAENNLGV
jgi:hypothetical protein